LLWNHILHIQYHTGISDLLHNRGLFESAARPRTALSRTASLPRIATQFIQGTVQAFSQLEERIYGYTGFALFNADEMVPTHARLFSQPRFGQPGAFSSSFDPSPQPLVEFGILFHRSPPSATVKGCQLELAQQKTRRTDVRRVLYSIRLAS
jgi:hypothetical protein